MKIAIAGKGGVGKTFIAGTLACMYAAKGLKTIAIDADTSPNLALMLGMSPEEASRILPIAENQILIDEKTKTDFPGVFKLSYTVDDIVSSQAASTPCGVQLLVMGMVRAMGSGCACPAHNLIRTLMSHLIVERNEILIMDMEAGVEHLGRGTAKNVDILLIITDAHQASLITAGRIADLARPSGIPNIAYIANRVTGPDVENRIRESAKEHNVSILAYIPYDQDILASGMIGKPVITETEYKAVTAVQTLAESLEQNFLSG
ncbi:ATP-binding protein [Methanospirillum lacunae]|uniref:Cobyrinic acid a,c-diamide synthase n=1 Tax=Methanospirillum lacunae TaxID=668570 RepID=A0A2V2N7X6_9EURY|nr:P-loop NTPase [Methanospirillum lacunae]PWR71671.1 cobyrinic acid a,c-diamide synthase [Methanospirillum lacunae]